MLRCGKSGLMHCNNARRDRCRTEDGVVTIKKYGNRRLYDTSRSSYINLDELAAMVRGGTKVQVVDVKTGEDLTREVLLQVVLEVLRGSDFFPVGMLERLIRATGDSPAQRMLRQQLITGLELMSAQLDRIEAMFPSPPQSAPRPGRRAEPVVEVEEDEGSEESDDELTELRERLDALEKRLRR